MKSFVTFLSSLFLAVVLAAPAFATNDYNGGYDEDDNAGGNAESTAIGVGVGVAGAKANSRNYNTNLNLQGQHQGQGQGQDQYQGQGQDQGQGQSQFGINKAVGTGNRTNVTVEGDDIDAEPAIAPGLAALVGTQCKGSVSVSGAGGGLVSAGIGMTYDDKECNLREAIKLLGSLPQGTTVRGHEVTELVGEMAAGLTGVEKAIAALEPEDDSSDVLHGDVYEDFNTGPYDR